MAPQARLSARYLRRVPSTGFGFRQWCGLRIIDLDGQVAREHVKEVTVAERFGQEVVAAGIEHFLTFLDVGVGGDGEDDGFRLHG
jgi:hypothetical protein